MQSLLNDKKSKNNDFPCSSSRRPYKEFNFSTLEIKSGFFTIDKWIGIPNDIKKEIICYFMNKIVGT